MFQFYEAAMAINVMFLSKILDLVGLNLTLFIMASWSGGKEDKVLLLYGWPNSWSIVLARAFSQAPQTVLAQDSELNLFTLETLIHNSYYYPKLLRHGHVARAFWNLIVQTVPVNSLSFRNSVTLSTRSMLDTK